MEPTEDFDNQEQLVFTNQKSILLPESDTFLHFR